MRGKLLQARLMSPRLARVFCLFVAHQILHLRVNIIKQSFSLLRSSDVPRSHLKAELNAQSAKSPNTDWLMVAAQTTFHTITPRQLRVRLNIEDNRSL
jgi:hypothetical protein